MSGQAHAAGSGADRHFRLGFRPELDGIRGLSITLVLLFHLRIVLPSGEYFLRGGSVGVDIFLVLSGFLITSILLEERRRNGSVSLRRFYIRRILRLWPALFTVCILASAWVTTTETAETAQRISDGSLYALLQVQNYAHALLYAQYGPVGHLWSVNLEQQFYLIWPGLLLFALRRRRSFLIPAVIVAIAATALLRLGLWETGSPFYRLYFAFETRGDALFLGCLLSVLAYSGRLESLRPRDIRNACLLAIGTLGAVALLVSEERGFLYQGGFLVVGLAAAVLIWSAVALPENGLLRRTLRSRWFRWVGARSYGIYLYHLLCYSVVFHLLTKLQAHSTISWAVLSVGLSLLVAALSFRYLELPMLRQKRRFQTAGERMKGERVTV